jgi:hypothetical protein
MSTFRDMTQSERDRAFKQVEKLKSEMLDLPTRIAFLMMEAAQRVRAEEKGEHGPKRHEPKRGEAMRAVRKHKLEPLGEKVAKGLYEAAWHLTARLVAQEDRANGTSKVRLCKHCDEDAHDATAGGASCITCDMAMYHGTTPNDDE